MIFSKFLSFSTIFIFCILFSFSGQNRISAQDNSSIALSFAHFNVLGIDHNSGEARLEFRHNVNDWVIYPFAGLMANSNGAFYFYSGLNFDFFITDYFVITPSFAPGLWHRGHSIDLNFLVEFRSQIELAYILENESRIGISFNHVSNGGFGESNPGVESLAVTYIAPISNISDMF